MFKQFVSIVICLSAVFLTPAATAIVNIEKVKIESNTKPFTGEFNLSLSGASGISEKEAVSMASRLQWDDTSTQFVVLKYDYETASDVKNTDKTFLHYRYIHLAKADLSWELFAQIEKDEFKLLKLRSLAGGGLRILLHKNDDRSLARLGVGLFNSREEYEDLAATVEELIRANFYFTYHYRVNKGVSFVSTTYFQPDLENTEDYRALEQLSVEFEISDRFTYFIKLDVSYDNKPVQNLEKDDTSYSSGIKYIF